MHSYKDNFLSGNTFSALLEAAAVGEFSPVESDVDNVVYPHICDAVPDIVKQEIEFNLNAKMKYIFMRRSPYGVAAPNQVHTDNSMGEHSLMLYLTDAPETMEPAGTSFLRHRVLGIAYAPQVAELVEMCRESSNNPDAWVAYSICAMKANRACIFDAGWFHRAEPPQGYGEGTSARTVLTAFF